MNSRLHLFHSQELREDEPLTRAAQGGSGGVPQHISFGVGNSLLFVVGGGWIFEKNDFAKKLPPFQNANLHVSRLFGM